MTNIRDYTETERETVEAFASLVRRVMLALFLLPCLAFSQPALDVVTDLGTASGTDITADHVANAAAEATLIFVFQASTAATDHVGTVTYGGRAVTELSGSPLMHGSGEFGTVHVFLADSLQDIGDGGTQSVFIEATGASVRTAVAVSVTSGGGIIAVEDVDATVNSDSDDNPQVTLSAGGEFLFAVIGFYSGQNDPASCTPFASWTSEDEEDFGTKVSGVYTYDTIDDVDVTAGYTSTAEDAVMIAVALNEVGYSGPETPSGQGIIIVE